VLKDEEGKEVGKREVSNATINRDLSFALVILGHAVAAELTAENPLTRARALGGKTKGVTKLRESESRRVVLSKAEVARLILACDPQLRPLVLAALFTGCRRGELLSLRWRDVSFDRMKLSVVREKDRSADELDLHPVLKEELEQVRDRRKENKGPGDFVFLNRYDEQWKDVRRAWGRALTQAKLGDRPGSRVPRAAPHVRDALPRRRRRDHRPPGAARTLEGRDDAALHPDGGPAAEGDGARAGLRDEAHEDGRHREGATGGARGERRRIELIGPCRARRSISAMNGPVARGVALACHANASARGIPAPQFFPDNSTCQFSEYIEFVSVSDTPGGKREEHRLAADPDAWFALLRTEGVRRVWLMRQPGNDPRADHQLAGLVGGGGHWWLVAQRADGACSGWLAREVVGNREAADRRIWRVTYGNLGAGSPPRDAGQYDVVSAARNQLIAALEQISKFSRQHADAYCDDAFQKALATLHTGERHGYHKDLAPAGVLPKAAEDVLDACQSAWVFGAMGSWNDQGFPDPINREFERVTAELYGAVCESIEVATNRGAVSEKKGNS
jgi:hypothetical protein